MSRTKKLYVAHGHSADAEPEFWDLYDDLELTMRADDLLQALQLLAQYDKSIHWTSIRLVTAGEMSDPDTLFMYMSRLAIPIN